MSNVPDPASEGLRARKRRATRAAIQQAALSLFLSKGYDETTTQEIARAADVSPGTLFNYFPTKEDLVADDYDPLFLDLLAARPLDEPPFVAIRKALQAGLEAVLAEDRAFLVARGRLALAAPALRAAASLDRARGAEALRAVLSSRGGLAPDAFELRVVSVLVVEALTAALEAWLEGGGEADLLALTGQALDVVEAGAGAVLSPSRP
ncbi:TetR family transcriptional regulator [Caulobacter sp. CCUG 60055]|uniref:TetR/AcrR family transcriptional regulator n=1 Tax=Caulobacter sp. CCUG 60055 TaxID=2100090 RepID=UPI001FA71583|nr:TetR/AcrR family transcriptional regulator [Caulobacter sp. CCUG 60055]MBQ1543725.1 TetR family transcriptional regulator [Caulobacteraceae bacterium]MCI3180810.1 TetR family transcriptional regulator [Caulobacter sp. CCUG 60055]